MFNFVRIRARVGWLTLNPRSIKLTSDKLKRQARRDNMKLNKWVKENGKWVEYKCLKFNGSKNYTNILMKASKLPETEIHFLINTLEDILADRKYIKDEQSSKQKG
jgi:hypothetical protein